MADSADISQDRMDLELELARREIASRPKLQPNGWCYNCLDAVAEQKLFCDCDCEADWDKRRRMRGYP